MSHNQPSTHRHIKSLAASSEGWERPQLKNASTQIRLLRFHPAPDDEEISADLEVFDLDQAPAFNAISYAWGTEPPQDIIQINGVFVTARPNCSYALWQARYHFPTTPVWLDAICINQDNLVEKASQVTIMGDIYIAATKVLACVGPSDECNDAVRYALSHADAVVQDLPIEWYETIDMSLKNPPQDEDKTLLFCSRFNQFCQRPYFGRVWIIQELFGGRDRTTILCGTYQLNWDVLVDLSMRLEMCLNVWSESPYPGESDERLSRLYGLLNMPGKSSLPLWYLLDDIAIFDRHDPRDRVFATLRLVDWAQFGKNAPLPDYEKPPLNPALDLMGLA